VCNLKEIANRARRVSMGLAVKRLKITPLGVKIEKGFSHYPVFYSKNVVYIHKTIRAKRFSPCPVL